MIFFNRWEIIRLKKQSTPSLNDTHDHISRRLDDVERLSHSTNEMLIKFLRGLADMDETS